MSAVVFVLFWRLFCLHVRSRSGGWTKAKRRLIYPDGVAAELGGYDEYGNICHFCSFIGIF